MDNLFQNNSGETSEHPPREMLLLFVDGELQAKEAAQLEAHLEACWPCRVKTQKVQDAIADIIEFDDQVLTPRLNPPQGWRNFDRKLNQLVAASGKQPLRSRLFGSLGRFLPSSHLFMLPRYLVRSAGVLILLALIVTLVIRLRHEPTVSASQFLANAIEAQALQTRTTPDPVVHQRLQVRRKDQTRDASVNFEIWNDTRNSRVREFLTDGNQSIPIPASASTVKDQTRNPGGDLISELEQVLKANHMDPARPLSAASYQSWHNTLQHQQDEVTRSKLPGGVDVLTLRTVPASPVNVGQIAEAVFVVRAKDWEPSELRLNVHAETGNRIYELTEDLSEVLNLAQVDPKIFGNETIASAPAPKASPQMSPASSPLAKLNPGIVPLVTQPVASADLEVEALRLLNQAGADLGEQISVKRTSAGLLEITGIVETDKRKSEIVSALAPLVSNPSVRIDIQTVAEAVAKQTSNKPTPLPSTRAVEITSNTMAAEPDLRAYFSGKGKDTDEAIRQYASRIVSLSGRAMDHLWAMKRLLNQFSPEEVRALTPEARNKWISLIRSHARSYQQTSESLRRELHPVFFPTQSLGIASEGSAITDIDDLTHLVNQLFELGSSNDRVIRSAVTSSSGGVMTTVTKTPQFWQSLKNAESLAARIAH